MSCLDESEDSDNDQMRIDVDLVGRVIPKQSIGKSKKMSLVTISSSVVYEFSIYSCHRLDRR